MTVEESIEKLNLEFDENKNSHVFLVETNDIDKALVDVKEIIKKRLNSNNDTNKQIDDENYIELCIIRPTNDEIKTDDVMNLQNRLKSKPVLSKNIFYVICNAEKLNEKASNKLLKTIEEPNEGTIGFLLTLNPDFILPTIKSRCESISLNYELPPEAQEAIDANTVELIKIVEEGNLYNLHKFLKKIDATEDKRYILKNMLSYYNKTINTNANNDKIVEYIKSKNDFKTLTSKVRYLDKTLNMLTKQMNIDLLYNKIFIEIKKVDL